LTLRAVAGLAPAEIARAFLVPERTLQQRLVRAKRKIAMAAIPFRLPPDDQLPDRVGAVCAIVYLIFNEGYDATRGDRLLRIDLAAEAIRLGRLLGELVPDDPEVAGLLALLLLHHARVDARVDPNGDLVPLEEQDRGRWDAAMIAEGLGLLDRALRRRRPGPYQLQAAIAAQHAWPPALETPTGSRSRPCTPSCCDYGPRPSMSSTGPWPSRWPTVQTPAWPCWIDWRRLGR
jgi:RNA polymerase sigma-70 factor (ECF subfamily)